MSTVGAEEWRVEVGREDGESGLFSVLSLFSFPFILWSAVALTIREGDQSLLLLLFF